MSALAEYVAQTGVTLVGIAALAWLIVYASRRAGYARDDQLLRLRGTLRLDARRSVYLVEVAGRVLVVAAGEGGISKLGELRREELGADLAAKPRSFSEVLDRLRGAKQAVPDSPSNDGTKSAVAQPVEEEKETS